MVFTLSFKARSAYKRKVTNAVNEASKYKTNKALLRSRYG